LINFNGTQGEALATFLVGWLLLLIVLKQLVHLTKSVGFFKFIDSIFGTLLGLARAALVLIVLLLITIPLSFVVTSIQTFNNQDLDLLNSKTFSTGKFIYQFLLNFINTII